VPHDSSSFILFEKNISISALEMALEMAGPGNRNWTSVTIGY